MRSDSCRGFDREDRRFFISPVLSWRISDRTDLTISLEYTHDQRPADFGLPVIGNRVVDVPRDRISNEPDDALTNKYLNVGYELEHRFSENWKIRNAFRYSSYSDSRSFNPNTANTVSGTLGIKPSEAARVQVLTVLLHANLVKLPRLSASKNPAAADSWKYRCTVLPPQPNVSMGIAFH